MHKLPLSLSDSEFADAMNVILERHDCNPNFVSFLMNSDQHCYLDSEATFTADTSGPDGDGDEGRTMLSSWLQSFPVSRWHTAKSECDGEQLEEGAWEGAEYCDASQAGKVFRA